MACLVVLSATLGVGATGADATDCDEWSERVNGHGARELRTIWRELGVRSRLFEDDTAGSLRVTRHELLRPHSREAFLVLDVTDRAGGDWQHLIFRRTGARCRFIGAVDVGAQGGEPPTRRLVSLPAGGTALAVRALTRAGTGLVLERETWYLLNMGGLERAPQAPLSFGAPRETRRTPRH
ncbi:MAG: hypothetical protein ACREKS_20870, partial [Candidatus Rokuibacteriota bacterium]